MTNAVSKFGNLAHDTTLSATLKAVLSMPVSSSKFVACRPGPKRLLPALPVCLPMQAKRVCTQKGHGRGGSVYHVHSHSLSELRRHVAVCLADSKLMKPAKKEGKYFYI